MKKVLSLIAAVGILASGQAQTVTNPPTPDFSTALTLLKASFVKDVLTNLTLIAGPSYNSSLSNKWGAELLVTYNTPKISYIPLQPRLTPIVGFHWVGNSLYGVSGSASLNADLHPGRLLTSNTNSLAYKFTVTPNAFIGAGYGLSGSTFGKFTVPGTPVSGTALIQGQGLQANFFTIGQITVGILVERSTWSTLPGVNYSGDVTFTYTPKGQ